MAAAHQIKARQGPDESDALRDATLGPDDIHVWTFPLEGSPSNEHRWKASLSSGELDRAGRFRVARDRQCFIAAHGVLREILAHYCQTDPQTLEFTSLASGKPVVLGENNRGPVSFNLSHSHGRGLVAVARTREVGVDLEMIRGNVDPQRLANRFFSSREKAAIHDCETSCQAALFFRYWVAKEAFLKFKGVGLQFPLDRCEVLLLADGHTGIVTVRDDEEPQVPKLVRFLVLPDGWVGAVAAEGSVWSVHMGAWLLG